MGLRVQIEVVEGGRGAEIGVLNGVHGAWILGIERFRKEAPWCHICGGCTLRLIGGARDRSSKIQASRFYLSQFDSISLYKKKEKNPP